MQARPTYFELKDIPGIVTDVAEMTFAAFGSLTSKYQAKQNQKRKNARSTPLNIYDPVGF